MQELWDFNGDARHSALQIGAEAVVLIPSWQIWKYEGICAEEGRQHFEVLCFLPARRGNDFNLICVCE